MVKTIGGKKQLSSNRGHKKGQGALKPGTALKKSNASGQQGRTAPNGTARIKEGGASHYRSEGAIKRIQMYKSKPNMQKRKEQPNKPVRIQPDRRWFGNTRVIAQDKMQAFRETLSKGVEDPYSVVLRSSKLPMSLLRETEEKASRMNLLSVEPFKEVFSKGRRQKRVKLQTYDMDGLLSSAQKKASSYNTEKDTQAKMDITTGEERIVGATHAPEEIFNKGTSRRIWAELWKVVDSSDVLVFVLDSRDPMGTRNQVLERELRKNRPHKHIILLLNKVDLVPTWVSRKWIQVLMKEFPTLAFHASITNPFGKNALLNLVRQFGNLMKEKKHVTVGMLGYPNVGKSSVINTMKKKKVCKSAPVPGETKVWQYIALTRKIYLLDCPGIVPPTQRDFEGDAAKLLKGVVRAERIQRPSDYISEVLTRVKRHYLVQKYKLPEETTWVDAEDFLNIIGKKMGKLLKGGDPDIETAARVVLYDWQRGRIPYFASPPGDDKEDVAASGAASSSAVADDAETPEEAKAPAVPTDDDPDRPAAVIERAAVAASNAGDEDEGESDGDEGDEKAAPADSTSTLTHPKDREVRVEQSLAKLTEIPCAHEFDKEDRRGDPVSSPPQRATGGSNEASTSTNRESAGRKRKAGEAAVGEVGRTGTTGKNKKRRKRGSGTTGNAGGGESLPGGNTGPAATATRQGSVDWQAVVSEFAM
eukprot:TRINITY_DN67370_c0_g1_i1.p1 TRINITY_DN67370_c0_g1~~TRINITY_DN67370_c0_g1_i1.p1  ORF type:complete len:702 (+),score=153.88 TRINITY_DN67370_c0_g1_i1:64-2169(+)